MKNTLENNNGSSIMDFPFNELISTSKIFLARFDDYQQVAGDKGDNKSTQYFVDSYNQLEAIIFNLKAENVTDETRNKIRGVIKETEKMAAFTFCN